MKKISIDPVTRLEGHGRIDIFLNDAGDVANAYMVISRTTQFRVFLPGQAREELAAYHTAICGVFPRPIQLALLKLATMSSRRSSAHAKKLAELFYSAILR